jgi:hypothetical protein
VIALALLIAAFVLFALAAVGVASGKYSLIAAGLACWALSALMGRLG